MIIFLFVWVTDGDFQIRSALSFGHYLAVDVVDHALLHVRREADEQEVARIGLAEQLDDGADRIGLVLERFVKFAVHASDRLLDRVLFLDGVQRLFVLAFDCRDVAAFFAVVRRVQAGDGDRYFGTELLAQVRNRAEELFARGGYLEPEFGFAVGFRPGVVRFVVCLVFGIFGVFCVFCVFCVFGVIYLIFDILDILDVIVIFWILGVLDILGVIGIIGILGTLGVIDIFGILGILGTLGTLGTLSIK